MTKIGKFLGVLIVIIIIGIIIGASRSPKGNDAAMSKEAIKIGISLPLTGDLAFIGEADKNAAMLAMDEISKRTDLKNKYELVIEDDSFNAAKGASSINKLINADKVNALISVGTPVGNVFAPIAEMNKIPHIGMASDANVAKGDYNFIDWTQPKEEVTAFLSELKKRNITKIAIIGANQQGWQAITDDLKSRAEASGITITANEVFNAGQTDFRTLISKIQKTKPDIYLLNTFDPELGILGKQIHDLGIKTPLTSIESFGLTTDQKPFEGQWYIDAAVNTSAFNQNYQQKYTKAPGPAAANTYDAINILVNAFETAKSRDGSDVLQAINLVGDYSGALGKLTLRSDGAFISQASVKVIKDGKAVLAQ